VGFVPAVEERVGEPGDAQAANLSMQNPASGREPLQTPYGEIDFCNERSAEACLPAFVPLTRFGEVLRGPWV